MGTGEGAADEAAFGVNDQHWFLLLLLFYLFTFVRVRVRIFMRFQNGRVIHTS